MSKKQLKKRIAEISAKIRAATIEIEDAKKERIAKQQLAEKLSREIDEKKSELEIIKNDVTRLRELNRTLQEEKDSIYIKIEDLWGSPDPQYSDIYAPD